jgi:hypothetical protein
VCKEGGLRLFGFNLNVFKKRVPTGEHVALEKLQRHLTLLLPESLELTHSIHPLPAHIDWRYVHTTSESIIKLQSCITDCMKVVPESKQELTKLQNIINQYLAKPARERSQEAELKFRAEVEKIAPKIIQLWIKHFGFKCDKFWARYLHFPIDS